MEVESGVSDNYTDYVPSKDSQLANPRLPVSLR